MMSTTAINTLDTIQTITNVRIILARISMPILLISGNVGEILSIIIFAQPIFRSNSCANYFLAASCSRLLFINFLILFSGLSFGYDMDPAGASLVFCKIKLYLSYIGCIVAPNLVVLACIDRWMLSSAKVNVRLWSQPWFAHKLVAAVWIFWSLFSIHAFFDSAIYPGLGYTYCSVKEGPYTVFIAVYTIIFNFWLPPILMTILGLMTILNVRRSQRQVHPEINRGYTHRKDRYLLRMLLFQVLINVVLTIPIAVYQIYTIMTASWQKDALWQTWELLWFTIALMIFYTHNCAGFYIYTLTGSIFREELKRIVSQCVRRFW